MKTLLLLLATVGMAFFASCARECGYAQVKEPEEEPSLPGVWHTVHHYFSLTIDAPDFVVAELISQGKVKEWETSADVSEAESYNLVFFEDGTGCGSGVPSVGREYFDFTWTSWYETLHIKGTPGRYDLFVTDYIGLIGLNRVDWTIEEMTADKMVMMTQHRINVDNFSGGHPWTEVYNCRYTFEKVKRVMMQKLTDL